MLEDGVEQLRCRHGLRGSGHLAGRCTEARMPRYAFIRRLRGLPPERRGRSRTVALTAYARLEDRDAALAAGYDRYLAKPIDPVDLAGRCPSSRDGPAEKRISEPAGGIHCRRQ